MIIIILKERVEKALAVLKAGFILINLLATMTVLKHVEIYFIYDFKSREREKARLYKRDFFWRVLIERRKPSRIFPLYCIKSALCRCRWYYNDNYTLESATCRRRK